MATATVTYTFSNGVTADAAQVTQDFADITTFLNTNVVQKDGSISMTGLLTLSGDGSANLHATSIQQWKKGPPALIVSGGTLTNDAVSAFGSYHAWGSEIFTITNPGRKVSILAWLTGVANDTVANVFKTCAAKLMISTDGGGSFSSSTDNIATIAKNANTKGALTVTYGRNGVTPSGDVKIKAQIEIDAPGGGAAVTDVSFANGYISVLMIPTP